MFTRCQSFDEPFCRLVLIVGMKSNQGLINAIVIQELPAGAGILTRNAIYVLERLKRAKAQIPKIADGRCD